MASVGGREDRRSRVRCLLEEGALPRTEQSDQRKSFKAYRSETRKNRQCDRFFLLSSFSFIPQDSEDDISHLEWETVRVRLIKAGTLEKLVESLASDTGELESTYVNIFLATYRTFSNATQVFGLIAKRYIDLNQPTVLESVRLQHKKYAFVCLSLRNLTLSLSLSSRRRISV